MAALLVALTVLLASVRSRPASHSLNLNFVAVLPLQARGDDAELVLAEDLTHNIINELSLAPDVTVISHASVLPYRGQTVDLRRVGKNLGVASVLTGRVQKAGTTLTLYVELTRTEDQAHVWGQQFTRDISERAALSQEVAAAVADTVRSNPTVINRQQLSDQDRLDADARLPYLQGVQAKLE